MSKRIEYSSNNSGGRWWLKDEDWKALEAAGWKVRWYKDDLKEFCKPGPDGRWLGALASTASKEGVTLGEAISEWERVTGQDSSELGCACCGSPHSFSVYEGDKCVDSYSPEFPSHGSRYSE